MRIAEFKDLKVGDKFKFDPNEPYIYIKKSDTTANLIEKICEQDFRVWPDEDVLLVKE